MTGIPKRIFYVWGAGEKKRRDVNLCLLSWREKLPDYEIIEINEESKKYFDFQKELETNRWFRTVYERKMYAFVADYVRVKILYEHGGIYLDTDVAVLKNFDRFLNEPAFVGIQGNYKEIAQEWTEPAILGAQKGNKFIGRVLDFYNEKIWQEPVYMIPDIFQYFLAKDYGIKSYLDKENQEIIALGDITLYPERYFIPYRLNQEFSFDCIEEDTHTIHLWGGAWNKQGARYFLKNKHRYSIRRIDMMLKLKKLFLFLTCQNVNKF